MGLTTLASDSNQETILEVMDEDGAAIIADAIPRSMVQRITDEVMPFIDNTSMGKDDFSGQRTQRTGALVARSRSCREMVMHSKTLGAAREFLAPFTERVTLHLTQTIYIHPQAGAQILHRDRLAWGAHLPSSIEPQFNTMWALTDFTASNGATRVVPGSHRWATEQQAKPEQIYQAEMSAGSVLLYTGSVLHSGGQNESSAARLGLNITYCLAWLRQEENQFLSCPPHIAKDLDPELQELLGYTLGNYALGYFSDPEPQTARAGILPPERALGRKPRDTASYSISEEAQASASKDFLEGLTQQNIRL